MGREGSRRVLLGSLRWMRRRRRLLATLEAWRWPLARSLGGGRSVVLELLLRLLRLRLLRLLRRAGLGGSGLSAVACRGQRNIK